MHLDDRHRNRGHGIAQRHGGVRIAAGIEHHAVVAAFGALQRIDQFALDIRLAIAELHRRKGLPQLRHELVERLRTVHAGFAPALQIEIGTVEYQ